MKCNRLVIVWGMLLVLVQAFAALADAASTPKQDYWMGIYYRQSKIGSIHITITEEKVDGRARLCKREELKLRYRLPHESVLYNDTRNTYTDDAFTPMSETIVSDYKGSTRDSYYMRETEITFGRASVTFKVSGDGIVNEKTIPFTAYDREVFTSGNHYDFGGRKLATGDKFQINRFWHKIRVSSKEQASLQYGEATVQVLRKENIKIGETTYDTVVVSESGDKAGFRRWHLDNGEMVKQEMPVEHIVWLRETKEKATEIDEGQGPLIDPKARAAIERVQRPPVSLDYWMGVYKDSAKIGYFHVVTRPDKLDGKDVFVREEALHLRGGSPDKAVNTVLKRVQYADNVLSPISETWHGTTDDPEITGPKTITMEMKFGRASAECIIATDGKRTSQTAPLTEEDLDRISAGYAYVFGVLKLAVGESVDANLGQYAIVSGKEGKWKTEDAIIRVLRRETLKLDDASYDTVVVSEKAKRGRETTKWLLESGEVVKAESVLEGVVWIKETREKAVGDQE